MVCNPKMFSICLCLVANKQNLANFLKIRDYFTRLWLAIDKFTKQEEVTIRLTKNIFFIWMLPNVGKYKWNE